MHQNKTLLTFKKFSDMHERNLSSELHEHNQKPSSFTLILIVKQVVRKVQQKLKRPERNSESI